MQDAHDVHSLTFKRGAQSPRALPTHVVGAWHARAAGGCRPCCRPDGRCLAHRPPNTASLRQPGRPRAYTAAADVLASLAAALAVYALGL